MTGAEQVGPKPSGLCSAHRDGGVGCLTCYPPQLLWEYAYNLHPRNNVDRAALYRQLMTEHGYLIQKDVP